MSGRYTHEKAVGAHSPDAIHESHQPEEMSAGRYATTRVTTLKPPMHKAPNPIRLLRMLSGKQWLFFLVGFVAWVCTPSSSEEETQTDVGTDVGCL